jgi:glutaredoxin
VAVGDAAPFGALGEERGERGRISVVQGLRRCPQRIDHPGSIAQALRYPRGMAGTELTLYQAEWCPYSSAVREVLTELGLDVLLRQVEPLPEQRDAMRTATGTDSIPVLVSEDGAVHQGTRAIFTHLAGRAPSRFAAGHRRQFADHREARETNAAGKLIERFRSTEELEDAERQVSRRA